MTPGPETGLALIEEAPQLAHRRMGGHRGERVGEPGPENATAPRAFVLNTGGAPRAWRLLASNLLGAQIVCPQEVDMSEREWEGFAKALKAKGFVGYYNPGQVTLGRYNNERYNGGAATIAHQTVRHTQGGKVQLEGCQMQGVWLQDVQLVNTYAPRKVKMSLLRPLASFGLKKV